MVEHSEAPAEKEREKSGPVQDTRTESEDQTDLPPGWVELVDESSGASYYLNEAENITTWDRPTVQKEEPSTKTAQLPTDEEPPLKEGWSEIVDPSSGKAYYFNEETGETTWDRPSAPSASGFPAGKVNSSEKSGQPPSCSSICYVWLWRTALRMESKGTYDGGDISCRGHHEGRSSRRSRDDEKEEQYRWTFKYI